MDIPVPRPAALAIAAAIAGCGGGGGSGVGDASFTDAAVGAGDASRELAFSWSVDGNPAAFRLEVNPDGASGFTGVDVDGDGDVDTDDEMPGGTASLDLPVPLHLTDFTNALYQVVALDAGGGELDRSGELPIIDIVVEELIGYFKASNPILLDEFGGSVALAGDGNTLAVGADRESSSIPGINPPDDNFASMSGAAYVFARDGAGDWSQQAYVKAFNPDEDDRFGGSVALADDGNTLAVGAEFEDGDATAVNEPSNNNATDTGAVYVFTRDGASNWSQQAYVKASNTGDNDHFGESVALSGDGDTLAVGADFEGSDATGVDGMDNDNAPGAGAVYVFTRDGAGTWSQQAYVKASNTGGADHFGESVTLSNDGNTLAVGAPFEDGSLTSEGAVYVFTRDGAGNWSQQAYLKASTPLVIAHLGGSVALSDDGDTLAAGAAIELLPGSIGNEDKVYVFTRDGAGDWSQQDSFRGSNTSNTDEDEFGESVALSGDGNTLAVGAALEDGSATGVNGLENDDTQDTGAVYVFTRDGTGSWSQQAYVKASNTGADDRFGATVSLSQDGNSLAVGANKEDSSSSGIDGADNDHSSDTGAAYLY